VIVTLGLIGAGVFAVRHFATAPISLGSGVPPTAALATGAPASGLPGPPADPFAGSPGDQWADGTAGIVVPAAKPAGSFSAAQVAAAYTTTRNLLIAQNLDPATLSGGAPVAFMNLLPAQEQREFRAALDKTGRRKDGSQQSSRAWVASFAPGTTAFIGTVIKVHGTMSARSGTLQGRTVLLIDVNYRFVYPVKSPGHPSEWTRVVGQVLGYEDFDNWDDPGGALQPWFNAVPSEAGVRCDSTDGYIRPYYPASAPDKVQPSGTPIDPYSMDLPKPANGCELATRT
jgi:hypothetical protein